MWSEAAEGPVVGIMLDNVRCEEKKHVCVVEVCEMVARAFLAAGMRERVSGARV